MVRGNPAMPGPKAKSEADGDKAKNFRIWLTV